MGEGVVGVVELREVWELEEDVEAELELDGVVAEVDED